MSSYLKRALSTSVLELGSFYTSSLSQLISKKSHSYPDLATLPQDRSGYSPISHETLAPSKKLGFFVILVSFSIILLSEGMSFSFGTLIIEIKEDFKDSQSKVAFIGSLVISFPLILGPVASYLTDAYGVQNMIIYGSFISALGFYCGYLVNSVNLLILTVCISGFGLALIDVAAIVIIVLYFKKKRALATSLSLSGMGIGTVLFPLFISYLLEHMAWREVFVVIGSLLMSLIPYGVSLKHSCFGLSSQSSSHSTSSSSSSSPNITTTLHSSLIHFPTYMSSPDLPLVDRYANSLEGSLSLAPLRTVRVVPKVQNKFLQVLPPSYLVYKGAVSNSYQLLMNCFSCPNIPLLDVDFHSCQETNQYRHQMISSSLQKMKEFFLTCVDVSILKNKYFALFCLSGFLYYLSLDTTYLYLPSLTHSRGLSKWYAALMITFIGISNTIFMLMLSVLVSEPRVKPSFMFAVSSLLNSLLLFALPSLHTLVGFATASTIFGILVSLEYVFSPLIVIEFTTLDKFTNAYGLLLLVEGVATLVGPPLAGCTIDYFQSYSPAFYGLAVSFLLSGIIVIGIILKHKTSPSQEV